MDTGLPLADAQNDFLKARRRRSLSRLAERLRRAPDDLNAILPYEEVVHALGIAGERPLGVRSIPLESIVGTVDRRADFDRRFRPTTNRVRSRWERIARGVRTGEPMEPISVYRVGPLYFVRDGHHRVSVARAMGWSSIDADVTEVRTRVRPGPDFRLGDLALKGHERLFDERVPLSQQARERIQLTDPWDFGNLAEAVEAWGFRAIQDRHTFLDRQTVAREWFEKEYVPVEQMLREAGFVNPGETETEAYLRVAAARYRLLRTHRWNDEVMERLKRAGTRRGGGANPPRIPTPGQGEVEVEG